MKFKNIQATELYRKINIILDNHQAFTLIQAFNTYAYSRYSDKEYNCKNLSMTYLCKYGLFSNKSIYKMNEKETITLIMTLEELLMIAYIINKCYSIKHFQSQKDFYNYLITEINKHK